MLVKGAPLGSILINSLSACYLFSTKLLSEPMLTFCQLDLWENISTKLELKYNIFHWRKLIQIFFLSSNSECVETDWSIQRVNYNRHQTIQEGYIQATFKWYTSPQEHGPILCCMHSARHRPTQIAVIKILRKQHHQGCTYCFDKTWLVLNSLAPGIFQQNFR